MRAKKKVKKAPSLYPGKNREREGGRKGQKKRKEERKEEESEKRREGGSSGKERESDFWC